MPKVLIEHLKPCAWAVWLGALAAIAFGSGWVGTAGHLVFWLTLAAHFGEFVVKRELFERAGGSMSYHFVQTLVYGLCHWKPIEDRLAERPE